MIKYSKVLIVSLATSAFFVGCTSSQSQPTPSIVTKGKGGVTTNIKNGIKTIEYITCTKPTNKKLIISNIKCKSTGCQKNTRVNSNIAALLALSGKTMPDFSKIGTGLGNMLQTSLNKTKCFEVLDREMLEELKQEMAIAGKKIELESADILVTGAITSISYQSEQKSLGGGFIPIIGMVRQDTNTANLGMDMKIIDVNSAKVVLSQDYYAKSGQTKYGYAGGAWGGSGAFGGAFSSMNGTSMEEVSRDIINRLTYDIVKKFAPNNYKIVTENISTKH